MELLKQHEFKIGNSQTTIYPFKIDMIYIPLIKQDTDIL